ncbi:MAG: SLC13 family permease [Burkholderiales bacterium]|nr:SLC13 family permease [Burkholderiales bacterium]
MTVQQILILTILLIAAAMFLWDRWRHDMVAMCALFACLVTGLVPAAEAFSGFGHPAVITVACILILSSGLKNSGAVDALTRFVVPAAAGPTLTITVLTALAAVLSSFMNNVGALALLMPVAIQVANKQSLPPGRVLMPVAFGAIFGGITTLIGTPPNLIVAGFRQQAGDGSFGMFDFAPVGLPVAVAGVLFMGLIGWRLVPARKPAGAEGFDTGAYLTEAVVPEGSATAGKTLREIDNAIDEIDAQVIGVVRSDVRVTAPSRGWVVRTGDILIIEAEAAALASTLSTLALTLVEAKTPPKPEAETEDTATAPPEKNPAADESMLAELAILPASLLVGRSASDVLLRTRYGINLLAVSRKGQRLTARLRSLRLDAGDLLLMQGSPESLNDFASSFGCVPLAERQLRIPDKRMALTASGIMAAAVIASVCGIPAEIAFAVGVLASMIFRTVSPRAVYEAVDWPVIVLLAALMPVANAIETTGTADVIARVLLENIAGGNAIFALVALIAVTMLLSDLMNNAATAAVMCPIAIGAASQLGVSADPFLMAVALGASCAFLTPIGHQNNTLILGPGGFRFGDYWKLGLPLEILTLVAGVPLLLIVWPL